MAEQYANDAVSTLNGAIDASVTSLTVVSATTFPTTGNFRVLIDSEILLVTAVAGAVFTVTRGAESTTAASHVGGATVRHVLTVASFRALLDPPVTIGTGDVQNLYGTATTAQKLIVRGGTAGTPDTLQHPLIKAERTVSILDADITGDGGELLAAIEGISVGTSTCEVQAVGVYGAAKNSSTYAAGSGNDACGIYGAGRITAGDGSGIGGFFIGRRDVSTGRACGMEVNVANYSGVAGTYHSTAASATKAIWITADGDADSGAAIQVGNPWGYQFEVGLGFNGQVVGGKTGGVATATIRDDGNATTVLDINGAHTDGLDLSGATFTGDAIKMGAHVLKASGGFRMVPTAAAYEYEEFLSGAGSTATIGKLGWLLNLGTATHVSGEANHPGIVRRATSATPAQYAGLRWNNTAGGPILPVVFFDMTWVVRPNVVDADTLLRLGMGADANANPANDGIYFEKLAADTNWFRVTRASSSQTRTDTGIACTAAWTTLRIRRIDASTIGFTINANAEQTATATIPTVALNPFCAIYNVSSVDKTMDLDFMDLLITSLSR